MNDSIDNADGLHTAERLDFLGIDADTRARVKAMQSLVEQAVPEIVGEFYARLQTVPALAPLLTGAGKIDHLKGAQAAHWSSLFSGAFDETYFARAVAIGTAHDMIGLEPRWYLGSYCFILEKLASRLLKRSGAKPEAAEALNAMLRAVFLDMDLAISTYIERGEAGKLKREMITMAEVIDREVQMSVGEISAQAARLSEGADRLLRVAETLRETAERVTIAVDITSGNVQTVAGATEELEASGRSVGAQVAESFRLTADAAGKADATATTVATLSDAAAKIDGVVRLITTIAGQTRMLALNANIEAARAGEAGKGFSVVANEVKGLARQTEEAIQAVSTHADSIRNSTINAVEMVADIATAVHHINDISADISRSTDEQRSATGEISRSAGEAASHTMAVAEGAKEVLEEARITGDTARRVSDMAGIVSRDIVELQRRLNIIVHSSAMGDRRTEEREPAAVGFTAELGGHAVKGHTGDMSPHGLLLCFNTDLPLDNARGWIELEGIGRIGARVVAASPLGVHIQIVDMTSEVRRNLQTAVRKSRDADKIYITRCQEIAANVTRKLADAAAASRITIDQLFDIDYEHVAHSNPKQFTTRFTALCEELLPDLIESERSRDERVAFCLVCDRNGYIPVHHKEVSHPQREDDPAWNHRHCRNRRIFDDRTGLLAARNLQPKLVQTYLRDVGGGEFTLLKEINAPIMIDGRHWGGVRLALKP
jgi:methyl-accepting chemotaxis protein